MSWMQDLVSDIQFECPGPAARLVKRAVVCPLANYLPAGLLRSLLRLGESQLAASNWDDPGGWRSMVISYDGNPPKLADKVLVGGGAMAMALRNRRKLGSRVIARLIDESPSQPVQVLCLGAGPGHIINDALRLARRPSQATLVDISSDAFEYGRALAQRTGLDGRVRFIQCDVREVRRFLDHGPDVVKMIGICEYLDDEVIVSIARAAAEMMPPGASVVFNSLTRAHGTDRFFRRVLGLHMIHRSAAELQELMAAAGFGQFVSAREPLGVYDVIVGRKA